MNEARSPMSPAALVDALDRFITDNRHSRDVDNRWLASLAEVFIENARHVRNGELPPDLKQKVAAFRAAELSKEMDTKQRELVDLERELKLVKKDAGE